MMNASHVHSLPLSWYAQSCSVVYPSSPPYFMYPVINVTNEFEQILCLFQLPLECAVYLKVLFTSRLAALPRRPAAEALNGRRWRSPGATGGRGHTGVVTSGEG